MTLLVADDRSEMGRIAFTCLLRQCSPASCHVSAYLMKVMARFECEGGVDGGRAGGVERGREGGVEGGRELRDADVCAYESSMGRRRWR